MQEVPGSAERNRFAIPGEGQFAVLTSIVSASRISHIDSGATPTTHTLYSIRQVSLIYFSSPFCVLEFEHNSDEVQP